MATRILTYRCPRCDYTIPTKSRAKQRFDSFCPRCHYRITIWWPSRTGYSKRGARRKVQWRAYHTDAEAREAARAYNEALQRRLHTESLHRLYDMNEGFVPASKLDSQILRDYLLMKKRQNQ